MFIGLIQFNDLICNLFICNVGKLRLGLLNYVMGFLSIRLNRFKRNQDECLFQLHVIKKPFQTQITKNDLYYIGQITKMTEIQFTS